MKNPERTKLIKQYGHLYSRHFYEHVPESLGCFYCGDIAVDLDHCPPISWIESKTTAQWKKQGYAFLLVPACKDCNNKLGSKPLFTLEERVVFMESKLLAMYEKQANLWGEDEIAEMSPMFQRTLRAKKSKALHLVWRAHNAQWRLLNM